MFPLLLALACSEKGDDVHRTVRHDSDVPLKTEGPLVLLIVLDTLRADHLSQYGFDANVSPGLERLAATSMRFTHAYAPAPWTLPSTTSILTGNHPLRHGLRHSGDVLPPEAVTLAETLRAAGWATAGWSYNVNIAPSQGHDQGFDEFTSNTGKVLAYPHSGRMTAAAAAWLKARPTTPALVYLQPMNCHGPYKVPRARRSTLLGRDPSDVFVYYGPLMKSIMRRGQLDARDKVGPKYLTSLKEQYTTAIRYETDEVGKLLAGLEADGRYDDALIVLTSDHGEELYDHGGFSHGYTLYDELMHVPLFVKLPGQKEARVVDAAVSTVDVTPTVLDALGLPVPELDGRSLRAAAAGAPIGSADQIFDVHWAKRTIAQGFLRDGWKLVRTTSDYQGVEGEHSLFHLAEDPGENHDLSATDPARLAELGQLLDSAVKRLEGSHQPQNVLSDMDRDQLEALGYLE